MLRKNAIVSAITLAAAAIEENCSSDETKLLSAVFVQLSDTLATLITVDEINAGQNEAQTGGVSQTNAVI